MKKTILTIVMMCFAIAPSFAHYLWIETNPTGSVGNGQEIKVHYGEYTYGVIEEVEGEAFPKVSKFTVWVVSPSGEKTVLQTTAEKTYYKAVFTPEEEGTYTVLLNNNEIDVIDYTQYDFGIFKTHYHAMANVHVGNVKNDTAAQNENGLTVKRISTEDEEVKLQVLYKNKPLSKNEVAIYVADLWSKKLETDENGYLSFKQPWDTKYIVETTYKEEVPGTYKGDDYEFIWHCATYCMP
ncbi:DUF4198 domain-containing protein [Galbibacter sp. EGI 63066]|uniref:DUF4198 domain-containing protein n=1 Tax=Galbibacter sp. EGI 63066 TaxID=2993559 RepID=UPI0022487CC0|nr:DUF4198 domain-containing protein [Galbibacter sp. EGI 63066]MCX2679548.1 DUF4198 domain-containing protein [Galbibacter sp. EGI 63066]